MLSRFFRDAYSLAFTARYSMKQVIRQENVATHSYFVALGVMEMRDKWRFDVGNAVQMALAHDVPEMSISDVNHLVKQRHPELAASVAEVEVAWVHSSDMPATIKAAYFEHLGSSVEALVVRYCDAMQCGQYALSELNMGNTNMAEVYEHSKKRCAELEAQLIPARITAE